MKVSKKIIGVLLALALIVNVFTVVSTADFASGDTAIKMTLRADKQVYSPGDYITLTISTQVHSVVGNVSLNGGHNIAYNSKVLEPYSLTSEDISGQGFTPLVDGFDDSVSSMQLPGRSAPVSDLYDWDMSVGYCLGSAEPYYFPATEKPVDLFTVQMKVKDDAPSGTYTIGFNPFGYSWEDGTGYVEDETFGGIFDPMNDSSIAEDYPEFAAAGITSIYECGTCTFSVSNVKVTHEGTQAKWNGGNSHNTADNYLFGFLGKFTGLDVETNSVNGHDEVTNIKGIQATATYNGSTVTSDVVTIWKDGEGYKFRAVFKDFDLTDTKDVEVKFVLTMSDGSTQYVTADTAKDTPNGIYNAAVGRGMPAVQA